MTIDLGHFESTHARRAREATERTKAAQTKRDRVFLLSIAFFGAGVIALAGVFVTVTRPTQERIDRITQEQVKW